MLASVLVLSGRGMMGTQYRHIIQMIQSRVLSSSECKKVYFFFSSSNWKKLRIKAPNVKKRMIRLVDLINFLFNVTKSLV